MKPQEKVYDSPTGWVARHVRGYVETDGRKGHRWSGVSTLLLTTRGRKTGKLRRTALIYGEDSDRYLVVGSKGGEDAPVLVLESRGAPRGPGAGRCG